MDEKIIKRQLKRITIGSAAVVVLLLVCGAVFWNYFMRSLTQSAVEQMKAETAETKGRIEKQMTMDFQVLQTLAAFIGCRNAMEEEDFPAALAKANKYNAFNTMSYFPLEGNGILSMTGQEVEENVPIERLNANARDVIYRSFQGEEAVSRLFDSMASSE